MVSTRALCVVVTMAAACGGRVTSDPSDAGNVGGANAGGASAAGGLAGNGAGGSAANGSGGTGIGGQSGFGAGGSGGGGTGGTSGSGGTAGTGGAAFGTLGSRCTTNADCTAPLTCWNAADYPVGPAKGICTQGCKTDPGACGALAQGAVCHDVFGVQVCLESCVPDGGNSSFVPTKCQGRPELWCVYAGEIGWACMPGCNTDADCNAGKHCSPKTGLCQAAAVSGAKTGAVCKSWDDCRGACLLQGAQQVCADRCTVGAANQCGWQGPGTKAAALCVLGDGWSNATTGKPESVGDYGYCAATCDCDAECPSPGLHCRPLTDAALVKTSLKRGFCSTSSSTAPMVCDG